MAPRSVKTPVQRPGDPGASSEQDPPRLLVLGAGGLLGRALMDMRGASAKLVGLPHGACDITRPPEIAAALDTHRPDWVVNTAAWTAVDACEADEVRARAVNGEGAGHVAAACAARGVNLLHLSTDYVFDGSSRGEWRETDAPAPLSAYGRSKLAGEEAVRRHLGERALIVRAQWLYGEGGPDFVEAIRKAAAGRDHLRVVEDQRGTPTWASTLAELLLRLVARGARGTVHAAASGRCTRLEWAQEIALALGLPVRIEPCTTAEYPRPARRPASSVFDMGRLNALLGGPPPEWRAALRAYLATTSRP